MPHLPLDRRTLRLAWNWTPILMFHEVLPDGTDPLPPYSATQSQLRAILRDFVAHGYEAGTLDDVLAGQGLGAGGNGARGRGNRVVLTFDDGTHDFVDNALPVLQELGFTATLFIVAGMVGGRREWKVLPGQPELTPVPLLDAGELRALHADGFTIGSHTMTHPLLTGLGREEAQRELSESRRVLSEIIGAPVDWFAYPYLGASAETKRLVQEAGYRGACGGPNQPHSRYYLNRIDGPGYSLSELRLRSLGWYHMARQVVRGLRYGIR
jgi:peptidoglycan/xylan/chitin deacetylase (PgdA/CDA1 family)